MRLVKIDERHERGVVNVVYVNPDQVSYVKVFSASVIIKLVNGAEFSVKPDWNKYKTIVEFCDSIAQRIAASSEQ